MGFTVLAPEAALRLMSPDTSAAIAQGQVVIGATSATLRGTVAGDVMELEAAGGSLVSLTIGRVAAQAGVNVETIRYYQRVGLVGEPPRPLGSIRLYGAASVGRLVFIKRAVIRILNRRSPPTVPASR